jgi:hypothetical protein
MASSATGWAAVIDGVLNIRTVGETANMAAVNALFLSGFRVFSNCADPDCDCMVKALGRFMPGRVELLRVKVEAIYG